MQNEADSGDDINGTVYVYAGTDNTAGVPSGSSIVKAIIDNGNNQTQMAVYTIPRGKVGFLMRGELGFLFSGGPGSGLDTAELQYRSRRYGKVFKVKKTVSLITGASSIFQDCRTYPDVIPALTDIEIYVREVTADSGFWATFDIALANENNFPQTYLDAIGQPTL